MSLRCNEKEPAAAPVVATMERVRRFFAKHRADGSHRKNLRMDNVRENLETINQARPGTTEEGVPVDGENSARL